MGIIKDKNINVVMVLNLCTSSDGTFLHEKNISKGFKVIERTCFSDRNFPRGIIPYKCRWSYDFCSLHIRDNGLYLYQVLRKYLKWFGSYCANTISIVKFAKGA